MATKFHLFKCRCGRKFPTRTALRFHRKVCSPPPSADGRQKPQTNTRALANLLRGPKPAPKGPLPTARDAPAYVQLRASGVPALDAVMLFARGDETLKVEGWRIVAERWEASPEVKAAWDAHNGGAWQELADDERIDLALRHLINQCCYVLYTSDIADPMAQMKKVEFARQVIVEKLAADKDGGESSKFDAFMRQLTERALDHLPPVFTGQDYAKEVVVLPAPTKES